MTKTFDWDICKTMRSEHAFNWLKKHHTEAISEESFVAAFKEIPYTPNGKKKNGRKPAKLKREYRNLKEKFGFFGGAV